MSSTKNANILDCLKLSAYSYSNQYLMIEVFLFSILSILLPVVLSHPQIIVGIAVNFMLARAALTQKTWLIAPVVILPCVGAYLANSLLGLETKYLLYFIPLIWIGNFIYVYSFKKLMLEKKKNFFIALITGSLAKSALLFSAALILVNLAIVPKIFLTSMGVLQITTALIGGTLAFGVYQAEKAII